MKQESCSREQEILSAHKAGNVTAEMKEHQTTCSICSDLLLVSQWMGSFKEAVHQPDSMEVELPEIEEIWQRARSASIEIKEREKRALLPLLIPRMLSYLVALLGVFFLVTADLSAVKRFIGTTLGGEQIIEFFTSFFPRFINSSVFVAIPFFIVLFSMAGYFFYSLINPEKS